MEEIVTIKAEPQEVKQEIDVDDIAAKLTTKRYLLPFFTVSVVVPDTSAATAANYGVFFTAPFACEVIEAWEVHKTACSSNGDMSIEKLTPTETLDQGDAVIQSTWTLSDSANQPRRKRANANQAGRTLSPGDRLALQDNGTLTSTAHVQVTVLLRPLNYRLSQVDNPS